MNKTKKKGFSLTFIKKKIELFHSHHFGPKFVVRPSVVVQPVLPRSFEPIRDVTIARLRVGADYCGENTVWVGGLALRRHLGLAVGKRVCDKDHNSTRRGYERCEQIFIHIAIES